MTKKQKQVTYRWTDKQTDGQTDASRELTFVTRKNAVFYSLLCRVLLSCVSLCSLSLPNFKYNSVLNSRADDISRITDTSENLTTSLPEPLVELSD